MIRNDPIVIGGTGGSGTSALAKCMRTLGLDIGCGERDSEWRPMAKFVHRWGRPLVAHELTGQPADLVKARFDLGAAIATHEGRRTDGVWGWKVPQCCLLLGFIYDCLPDMRYIHVVRDGRDMALSGNQSQADRYSDLWVSGKNSDGPVRSAESWSIANCLVLDTGRALLGDRLMIARYEDLTDRPIETLARLARFAGLTPSDMQLANAAEAVKPSEAVGRHRTLSTREVRAVTRAAEPALRAFGYLAEPPAAHGAVRPPRTLGYRPRPAGHVVTEAFGALSPDGGAPTQPAGLLVLGVVRSGTSVATELAASLGLHAPGGDLMGPDRHNPTGYWESRALSRLDDLLLGQWDANWWLAPPAVTPEMVHALRGYSYLAASTFAATFPDAPWVWKDPRLVALLPFWDQVLGRQPALLVHRDPREVAQSISRRDGFTVAEGLAIWERHTRLVLAALAGRRVNVSNYAQICDDPGQWRGALASFCARAGLDIRPPRAPAGPLVLDRRRPMATDVALSASQAGLYETVRSLEGTHKAFPAVDLAAEGASVEPALAALGRRTQSDGDLGGRPGSSAPAGHTTRRVRRRAVPGA